MNRIAVIGGDKRQFYIGKLLASEGMKVTCLGVEMNEEIPKNIEIADSLKHVMKNCDIIIGPIPFTRDGIHINSNKNSNIEIEEFTSLIRENHIIFGGILKKQIIDAVNKQSARYFDFMTNNEIAIKNAVATAEGTIVEAVKLSDINLDESKCLVLGYGRCAKALATRLNSLGAKVTIAARSQEQLFLARSEGLNVVHLNDVEIKLSKFDFIFNTIPAKIITAQWLKHCNKDVAIIDIASKPGGTDFEECKKLGIKAVLALGLPGKYSPKTSAMILIQSIRHLLPHEN